MKRCQILSILLALCMALSLCMTACDKSGGDKDTSTTAETTPEPVESATAAPAADPATEQPTDPAAQEVTEAMSEAPTEAPTAPSADKPDPVITLSSTDAVTVKAGETVPLPTYTAVDPSNGKDLTSWVEVSDSVEMDAVQGKSFCYGVMPGIKPPLSDRKDT